MCTISFLDTVEDKLLVALVLKASAYTNASNEKIKTQQNN